MSVWEQASANFLLEFVVTPVSIVIKPLSLLALLALVYLISLGIERVRAKGHRDRYFRAIGYSVLLLLGLNILHAGWKTYSDQSWRRMQIDKGPG